MTKDTLIEKNENNICLALAACLLGKQFSFCKWTTTRAGGNRKDVCSRGKSSRLSIIFIMININRHLVENDRYFQIYIYVCVLQTTTYYPPGPENEIETGKLIKEFDDIPFEHIPPSIETAKGSILDNDLKKAR